MAGCGHGLACDAVDLVESMWPQETVVCRPDEQLQSQRLALHVAVKLKDMTHSFTDTVYSFISIKLLL